MNSERFFPTASAARSIKARRGSSARKLMTVVRVAVAAMDPLPETTGCIHDVQYTPLAVAANTVLWPWRSNVVHQRVRFPVTVRRDFVLRLRSWFDPEKRAVVFVRDDI